jgi:hypothetical protein
MSEKDKGEEYHCTDFNKDTLGVSLGVDILAQDAQSDHSKYIQDVVVGDAPFEIDEGLCKG